MWTRERIDSAKSASALKLGYAQLSTKQAEVLQAFLSGNDVFVSLPTGSGKSLCYWSFPFTFNILREVESSIVLVVSPLIALMKNQVESLSKRGKTLV